MASVGGPVEIAASGISLIDNSPAPEVPVGTFRASPIDITFRNAGGEPSLITGVVVEVEHYVSLADCTRSGAGPAGVSAEYSIKFPGDLDTNTDQAEIHHDVRFEIKPGSIDRMQITVGPKTEGFNAYPFVLGVRVSVTEDNGQNLDVGNFALVGNHRGLTANLDAPLSGDCAQDNLTEMQPLLEYQSTKSTEFLRLQETFMNWATT